MPKKPKKPKKVKKLKVVDLWSVSKQIAKKNFEEVAKEDAKDFKDDPEELLKLKNRVKSFSDLYKKFDQGLTKKLKAVEGEEDPGKLLNKAGEALIIIKDYEAELDDVTAEIGSPKKVGLVLGGALQKVRTDLEATVKLMTEALAEQEEEED